MTKNWFCKYSCVLIKRHLISNIIFCLFLFSFSLSFYHRKCFCCVLYYYYFFQFDHLFFIKFWILIFFMKCLWGWIDFLYSMISNLNEFFVLFLRMNGYYRDIFNNFRTINENSNTSTVTLPKKWHYATHIISSIYSN